MMFSIMAALYNEREGLQKNLIAKIQEKLREDFKHRIMTGTRVKYKPNSLDGIIHNYNTPEEYSVNAAIVGPGNWVTPASGLEDSIEGLLGMRELTLLENVLQWASEANPFLWRVNSKSTVEDVRVLEFGIVSGSFSIIADESTQNDRPARGVASQKISKGNEGNNK